MINYDNLGTEFYQIQIDLCNENIKHLKKHDTKYSMHIFTPNIQEYQNRINRLEKRMEQIQIYQRT